MTFSCQSRNESTAKRRAERLTLPAQTPVHAPPACPSDLLASAARLRHLQGADRWRGYTSLIRRLQRRIDPGTEAYDVAHQHLLREARL